jgi:IMP cyclohydrolase
MIQGTLVEMTEANRNLVALSNNIYPGRGIVAGLDETGRQFVQVYILMGRSPNSRYRYLVTDGKKSLCTKPIDASSVQNADLVIYEAMASIGPLHIVSNGDQTATVLERYKIYPDIQELYSALSTREYEPDKPNFTARITAISVAAHHPSIIMSIIRKSECGDGSYHEFYKFDELDRGFGYCLTTYAGDGDPLPTFVGDPYVLPLVGKIDDIANTYWGILNEGNRVALAVKFINIHNGASKIVVINKYQPAG